MNVLQFTIPVSHDKSVITLEEKLPYFYPYLHRHLEIQLTWVMDGTGSFVAGTNVYTFNPGDIFFIGANQPHIFKSGPEYFTTDHDKTIHSLTIFFDPSEKLRFLFNVPEMKILKTFLDRHSSGFKVPDMHRHAVAEKMLALNNGRNAERLIYFFELLQYLNSINKDLEPLSTRVPDKVSDTEGIRIGQVYEYIMQHYHSDIPLEHVAAVSHMTPQAFCRYFKKQTGHTFVGFLNEVRINEACKKLTAADFESVSTVAYTSGFNSITNFNRVFKTVTGKSPLEYVKEYRDASGN